MNPYSNYRLDPFEIGRLINLAGASFEAFKKIACAGIEGRKKDKTTDLKEAVFTVQRIIIDIDSGKSFRPNLQTMTVIEIVDIYATDRKHRNALSLFLSSHFTNYQSTSYLIACIKMLEEMIVEGS